MPVAKTPESRLWSAEFGGRVSMDRVSGLRTPESTSPDRRQLEEKDRWRCLKLGVWSPESGGRVFDGLPLFFSASFFPF